MLGLGGFSSGLKLTDLDDFIAPSQECIKPVETESRLVNKFRGNLEFEDDSVNLTPKYEKAKITLNDCLACSGCITSAEVVLVNEQSVEELCRVLSTNKNASSDKKLKVVLSLSTQSVLSISARYNLSPEEGLEKIVGYFKTLGITHVFDLNFARCFSIIEAQREFVKRFKHKKIEDSTSFLPVIASACPGWVCYAEKTHGHYILPYISSTRSPQQVMGALIKDYWAKKENISPDRIYHVALMPCFDKKLEASREEFYMNEFSTREVDCVITSVEVEQLLEKNEIDFKTVKGLPLDSEFSLSQNLSAHQGSGSGGYAHHVFCYAAKELFGIEPQELNWKALRNNDMQELTLEVNGEVLLRFAIANGFRNIQNLVQKLKRKKCAYDYVEVMACPSGCLNGGAQIRPTTGISSKELVAHLENLYTELPKMPPPSEERRITELYKEWLGDETSATVIDKLNTTYRHIEKNVNPLGIKW